MEKVFRLVSVVAALMLLPGVRSKDVVTGILGSNITLKFTFNKSYSHKLNDIGIYFVNRTKKDDCKESPSAFSINASTATVFYHMSNLSLQDSQVYFCSLYSGDIPTESNRVQLLVTEDTGTTTVSPESSPSSVAEDSEASRGLSSAVLLGTVLCPLLLMAAALPAVSWCLLRDKEPKDSGQAQDRPIPTVDEQVSRMVSGRSPSSVVYSVLDFPQRAPTTVLDMSRDTHYATISYLPQEATPTTHR